MNSFKNILLSSLKIINKPSFVHVHVIRNLGYRSSLALEKLYPSSSLMLKTPLQPETKLTEKFSGYIPLDQLEITYTKSSGPGGQNVNKVNTKVLLRFQLQAANWIDDSIKAKFAKNKKSQINNEGYLLIRSDLTRSQQLNLADCLNKLRNYIYEACYEPPPPSEESLEKARRRHEKEVRERLRQKREKSMTKLNLQDPNIKDLRFY